MLDICIRLREVQRQSPSGEASCRIFRKVEKLALLFWRGCEIRIGQLRQATPAGFGTSLPA
jgi:hypothetical protein